MRNPFSLENKTILVTGASSGIGRSIAIECSKMGAKLAITGRNEKRLHETGVLLEGIGHIEFTADLCNEEQISFLTDQSPVVEGIVHCAGIVAPLPFQFITKDQIEKIFSINFISPTLLSKQMVKKGKIRKMSSIVWISSIAGNLCVSPGSSLYSASKSAVNGIAKGMALEFAAKGIRVNTINPGVIETTIFSQGVIADDQLQEQKKKYPLKRFGKPEEIAYAAIFLLSDASMWMTGSHLVIDGGYTLL